MPDLEHKMWIRLREKIGPRWDCTRHEDKVNLGIPDVSWGAKGVNGWIELKAKEAWPVRYDTPVTIPDPERFAHQKLFLYKRGKGCWLLLKVGEEWLLFDHVAAQEVGKLNKVMTCAMATKIWVGVPDPDQFIDILTRTA